MYDARDGGYFLPWLLCEPNSCLLAGARICADPLALPSLVDAGERGGQIRLLIAYERMRQAYLLAVKHAICGIVTEITLGSACIKSNDGSRVRFTKAPRRPGNWSFADPNEEVWLPGLVVAADASQQGIGMTYDDSGLCCWIGRRTQARYGICNYWISSRCTKCANLFDWHARFSADYNQTASTNNAPGQSGDLHGATRSLVEDDGWLSVGLPLLSLLTLGRHSCSLGSSGGLGGTSICTGTGAVWCKYTSSSV